MSHKTLKFWSDARRHAPPHRHRTLPPWDEVSIWTSKAWDEVGHGFDPGRGVAA